MQRRVTDIQYLPPALLWLGLLLILGAVAWSALTYRDESLHTGEPLPMLTLSELVSQASATTGPVHLRDAVPDLSRIVTEDHAARPRHSAFRYTLLPLYGDGSARGGRVAVLSLLLTFPHDTYEQRHPAEFDPRDPVVEGQLTTDELVLWPEEVASLRRLGLRVDHRTLVFKRRALHGKVPPADWVDVGVPLLIGGPAGLVLLLMGLRIRWLGRTGQAGGRART